MSDNGANNKRLPDVGAYIRDQRRNAQLSLRKLAERSGVSNPYLSQIERGLRQPSAKILKGIADGALGVGGVPRSPRPGSSTVDPRTDEGGVLRSIFRDPDLTDGQRRELAETYERFRSETVERRARRQTSSTETQEVSNERYRAWCVRCSRCRRPRSREGPRAARREAGRRADGARSARRRSSSRLVRSSRSSASRPRSFRPAARAVVEADPQGGEGLR